MKKVKKKTKISILILLLLVITIGYAALQSTLNINGTSIINNSTWDIHWNNVSVTSGSVTGTNVTTAAHILTGNTEVEYSITLGTPGDFYEFTVDAVNSGSIDAMIGSFSNKVYQSNGTTERTLPDYLAYSVIYSDGVAVANNQKLEANSTETYKVRVEFKRDINANQLPSSADALVFKFNVNYVQADDNATERLTPYVYTANVFDGNFTTIDNGTNTSAVWIGQAIPNGIGTYQTPSLAMAALKQVSGGVDRPFFLRHVISNNVVTESYVGFVVSHEMAGANPGMIAGTYYLKVRKIYEYVGGSWQCMSQYDDGNGNCIDPDYNTNKDTILGAFGTSYCTDYSSSFGCVVSGLYTALYLNGGVDAGDGLDPAEGYWYCDASGYGSSWCNSF